MTQSLFPNGFAFIVGVGNDLPVTVDDAYGIQKILINPNYAGYLPDQVVLKTNEQATKLEIETSLKEFVDQVNVSDQPNKTIVIFFSGHGGEFPPHSGEYCLAPYDVVWGKTENPVEANLIEGKFFIDQINRIVAERILVILDCCQAGGIKSLPLKSANSPFANALNKGSGKVVISSCKDDEKSWARLQGETYSLFTKYLLEALEGKFITDSSKNSIEVLEAFNYIHHNVVKHVKDHQLRFPQTPIIDAEKYTPFSVCAFDFEKGKGSVLLPPMVDFNLEVFKKDLLNKLGENKFDKVIKQLNECLIDKEDSINFEGRRLEIQTSNMRGLLTIGDYDKERSKLRLDLIKFITTLNHEAIVVNH